LKGKKKRGQDIKKKKNETACPHCIPGRKKGEGTLAPRTFTGKEGKEEKKTTEKRKRVVLVFGLQKEKKRGGAPHHL